MPRTNIFWAVAIAALLSSTAVALAHDIVITGGRVIDPETGLDAIRNVAIDGDKIVAISEFPLEGDVVIDTAAGRPIRPRSTCMTIQVRDRCCTPLNDS
jgi:adenine deaminase